jgi:hypothetical protein
MAMSVGRPPAENPEEAGKAMNEEATWGGYGLNPALAVSMVKASELLGNDGVISTGYPELDKLIGDGGLAKGQIYLFYGSQRFVDDMIHGLLVRGSALGRVAYMNNTDYYSDKTFVDLDKLARYAKAIGMDPFMVFRNVYFSAAYNELRQPYAARALAEMIEREAGSTSLVLVHRLSRFLGGRLHRRVGNIDLSLSLLKRVCTAHGIPMVITVDCRVGERPAVSTTMMLHTAGVMVAFREVGPDMVQAELVKHHSKRTPSSALVIPGDYAQLDGWQG